MMRRPPDHFVARFGARFVALWFEPASPLSFRACRLILALHALWIVLSRPDSPRIVSWPAPFFAGTTRLDAMRYGIVPGNITIEWLLYGALVVALLLVAGGVAPRITSAAAGLLLYHFAPLDEIVFNMQHTHFGGLTTPALGLLILAFAEQPPRRGGAPSPEYRWPVMLVQLVFAFGYLSACLSKLRFNGLAWFQGPTIRGYALAGWAFARAPLGLAVASQPLLCWLAAIGTFILEAGFVVAVFSPRSRRLFVPMAFLFHLGIRLAMNIAFMSTPLLLLFVNWDWVCGRRVAAHHTPKV